LATLEFNADRKRMSVLIREESSDTILLLCKGADDVIFERLSEDSTDTDRWNVTDTHAKEFAQEGLRTLVMAYRYSTYLSNLPSSFTTSTNGRCKRKSSKNRKIF